jgi:hypothetical protein
MRDRYANQFNLGAPQLFDVRSVLNAPQQQPQQSAVNTPPPNAGMSGNWGLWMTNADRFARWPGYPTAAGQEIPLRRFETKAAAEEYLNSLRETNPRVRTDVEVREIEPERTPVSDINLFHDIPTQANANWEIVRDRGNQVVARFRASDQDNAIGLANTYIRSQGWNIDDYTVQAIEQDASQFREPSDSRGNLTPRGPGPWEIYRLSDGSSVRELAHTNRNAAESEARSALGLRGEAPELYGVRTRQQSQGGNEVGDRYTPTGSGEFTGQWFILDPDNIIIYKFGGIGNSQSDANRHAMNWLTRNPRQMVDGVTVVPEMG